MSDYPDLDVLVTGVKARDERAFTAVYDILAGSLAAFAFGMLRDRGAAEDVVQQAFLELVRAADELRGDGRSLRAWLFRSVRFSCFDEIRRRERHPEIAIDVIPDRPQWVDDVGFGPELETALAELEERHRSLILLKYLGGMSGAEVAAVSGSPRTAVYAATARAEKRLRDILQRVESSGVAASHQAEEVR